MNLGLYVLSSYFILNLIRNLIIQRVREEIWSNELNFREQTGRRSGLTICYIFDLLLNICGKFMLNFEHELMKKTRVLK